MADQRMIDARDDYVFEWYPDEDWDEVLTPIKAAFEAGWDAAKFQYDEDSVAKLYLVHFPGGRAVVAALNKKDARKMVKREFSLCDKRDKLKAERIGQFTKGECGIVTAELPEHCG